MRAPARRALLALLGAPVGLALRLRCSAWALASLPLRKIPGPLATRLGLAATWRWHGARKDESTWARMLFCQASGYPAAGWALRAGVDAWGAGSEVSGREADLLNHVLSATDAPWADPACSPDMRAALSAKARQLALHPLSAIGGSWVLRQIPPTRADLEAHFRKEAHALDPEWHARDQHDHSAMLRVAQTEVWRSNLDQARDGQEAFLEAQSLGEAALPSTDAPARPKPRL